MPSYVVRNENFRDEVLKYSYPFDEQSELENSEVFIGTDLFVDAVFYIKTAAELPLHIGVVDGSAGDLDEVLFVIQDNGGITVGSCLVGTQTTAAAVRQNELTVGALVFDPEGLQRFISRVSGKVIVLLPEAASFLIDCCHISQARHLRAVEADQQLLSGEVRVVARHGCRFAVTENNELYLDILAGALRGDASQPIVSVNGVRNQSIWLNGHSRANLRISNSGGQLTFGQAKDLT